MPKLNAVLVCGAPNDAHDSAFVASQLSEDLRAVEGLSLTLLPDYGDTRSIEGADVLISYIAERSPDDAECDAVRRYLERGGRWFALHTSNWVDERCRLPGVIGSRFITHPPYGPFTVEVTQPADPLLEGIQPFRMEDELYVTEHAADIEVLLHATWGGRAPAGRVFEEALRPLMYRRRAGAGDVLYLALGHCNAANPSSERRGSWQSPVFRELVRRGVRWAAGVAPAR